MTDDKLPTAEEVAEVLREEEPDELASLSEDERKVVAKILIPLTAKIQQRAEVKKAKELEALTTELVAQNKAALVGELERIRKANEPLGPEELTKLLSQEYLEFSVSVGRKGAEKTFTITELPVATEKRIMKVLQKTLFGSLLKELSALDWTEGLNAIGRVAKVVEMVPGALDALAEVCAVCLDPEGEQKVDQDWVLRHMSVNRMYAVLEAQSAANRWRDFFSRVYQAIPNQMIG